MVFDSERDAQKVVDELSTLEKADNLTDNDDVGLLVRSFMTLRQYEAAEAVVLRHPDNRLLDHLFLRILEDTGRLEEAELVRRKALDYALEQVKHAQPGKEKAKWLNNIGRLEADPKRKIEYFRRSVEEAPQDHVVNYNLAMSLKDDGHINEALKYARMSIQLNPEYTNALDLVTLLEDVQRAHEAANRPTEGRHEVFEAYLRRGDYQKVIDILRPLEKDGKVADIDVERLVKSLHQLRQYEEALAIVNRHPNNRQLDHVHADILETTGRFEEAVSVRQKALQSALKRLKHAQPGSEKAFFLNEVGLLQTDLSRRIEYFKKSVQECSLDCLVHRNLAMALTMAGQYNEALKHARVSVNLNPELDGALGLAEWLENMKGMEQ